MASLVLPCSAYCHQGLIRTRRPSCNSSRRGNRRDRCGRSWSSATAGDHHRPLQDAPAARRTQGLQRLEVGQQGTHPRPDDARFDLLAVGDGIEARGVGAQIRPEGVARVGASGDRRVVLLDQDRLAGRVADRRPDRPTRSRRVPRRSAGSRGGTGAVGLRGTRAGPASAPTRCAGRAPAPRCRAACRPCSRWCPRRRVGACRGSIRRAWPANRPWARTNRRPAHPRGSGRRSCTPRSPGRRGRSATRWW